MQKHWYHLVARTHAGLAPFWERERALPLWLRLRAEFAQDCLAAVVMPNHIHLLIQSARPAHLKRQLACQLRAYTRERFPGRSLWQKIPPPELVRDRQKLESTIRYIHLNPCRKRYTADPWRWEFSTLPDHSLQVPTYAGISGPWVGPEQLQRWLGRHPELWVERHRMYIMQDPYVALESQGAPRRSTRSSAKSLSAWWRGPLSVLLSGSGKNRRRATCSCKSTRSALSPLSLQGLSARITV